MYLTECPSKRGPIVVIRGKFLQFLLNSTWFFTQLPGSSRAFKGIFELLQYCPNRNWRLILVLRCIGVLFEQVSDSHFRKFWPEISKNDCQKLAQTTP